MAAACGLHAQAAAPVDAKVCDVIKNPTSFDGKTVRIKGTVVSGLDTFFIKDPTDPNCGFQVNGIWLSYPQGSKAKSGPAAMVTIQPAHNYNGPYKAPTRTPVTLDKSKDFKQFDSLLSQTHQKGADMCMGCTRYEVTATLVGRLDGVSDQGVRRDASGKVSDFGGFGNMNAYPARLVLESVSDVTPKEIDYSKTDAAAKGDAGPQAPGAGPDYSDPLATGQKIAANVAPGQMGDMAKNAIGVFPKSKEQNGVNLVYSATNEAASEEPAAKDSPDGVLYTCIINRDRLPGPSLVITLFHLGQHISDSRSIKAGGEDAPLFVQENNAWVISSVTSIVGGDKFLTLPGSYQIWNATWPADGRNEKIEAGLNDYLTNGALLSK